jgi:hypothetical protein
MAPMVPAPDLRDVNAFRGGRRFLADYVERSKIDQCS